MKPKYSAIFLGILLCEVVGIAGSFLMGNALSSWYPSLNKAAFTPPSWVFGPVWVTLYALMGAALGLVVSSKIQKGKAIAYAFFGVQLFLNALWSYLFFGLQNPLLGLIDIVLLWLFIAASMWKFYRYSKTATALLAPYILWVSIASSLNYFVFVLN